MGLLKITRLVMALARLHNFCISERVDPHRTAGAREFQDEQEMPAPTGEADPALACNTAHIEAYGGIPLVQTELNSMLPEQLLDAGNHFDDVPPGVRRQVTNRARKASSDGLLPQERLLASVQKQGLKRPPPKQWEKQRRKQSQSGAKTVVDLNFCTVQALSWGLAQRPNSDGLFVAKKVAI